MTDYSISTDKEIVEKAKVLITDDLAQVYSLPLLAQYCGVSVYSLKRVFKKPVGKTLQLFRS